LVLLEAVTGKREYPGGAVESAVARLHRPPELPASLPEYLRSLLERMTADDPAARPDAAEVAAQLEAALGPVGHPSRAAAIRRSSRELRRRFGPALVAVAASVLGGALLLSGQPELTQRGTPVTAEQPNPTTESVAPAIGGPPSIDDPYRMPEQTTPPPAPSEEVERADIQNLPLEGPPTHREQIGAPSSKDLTADTAESYRVEPAQAEGGEDATSDGDAKGSSNKNGKSKGNGKANENSQNKGRKSKD
jgi:hypothetical protein